jgi:hypothetical protein
MNTDAELGMKETFPTTGYPSQIAPFDHPCNEWNFVKTMQLHSVEWKCYESELRIGENRKYMPQLYWFS